MHVIFWKRKSQCNLVYKGITMYASVQANPLVAVSDRCCCTIQQSHARSAVVMGLPFLSSVLNIYAPRNVERFACTFSYNVFHIFKQRLLAVCANIVLFQSQLETTDDDDDGTIMTI